MVAMQQQIPDNSSHQGAALTSGSGSQCLQKRLGDVRDLHRPATSEGLDWSEAGIEDFGPHALKLHRQGDLFTAAEEMGDLAISERAVSHTIAH
jgi:hypothetical protein